MYSNVGEGGETPAELLQCVPPVSPAQQHLVIRVYPFPFGYASDTGLPDFASLIELIQNTLAPEKWDIVGGVGSVQESCPLRAIVVSQTTEIHDEMRLAVQSVSPEFSHSRGPAHSRRGRDDAATRYSTRHGGARTTAA